MSTTISAIDEPTVSGEADGLTLPLQARPLGETATVNVLIPVYNEAGTLATQIKKLDAYLKANIPYRCTVTIIDNGSTDRTWEIAETLTSSSDTIEAIHMNEKGKGRAIKYGWLHSQADVLAFMDVDLSTGLESFLALIEPLIRGEALLAIGSRLHKGAQVERSLRREFISRTYVQVIHFALGVHVSDAQCGFKAIRRELAHEILPDVTDTEWFFDTELIAKAELRGVRAHEVPVRWVEDADSRVNIKRTTRDNIKGVLRLRKEFAN